jgi:hypothetical protein
MANACGVAAAAGISPEDHEVIPIGMSAPSPGARFPIARSLLALPPSCLLTAA